MITPGLPDSLLAYLHGGAPALMLSVGADGYPHAAYTWVAALGAGVVRFGVDRGTVTFDNVRRNERAALQIIGPGGLLFIVKGVARLIKEGIAAAPFGLSLMEMTVGEVQDQSWAWVTVAPLAYEWAHGQRQTMLATEQAIYAELRDWKSET